MQFNLDAPIYSASEDELGRLERVVVDPRSGDLTHLVLRKGWFFTEDRVIPIELVESADENAIRLSPQLEDLDQLPHFEETHYVEGPPADPDAVGADAGSLNSPLYWYPPSGVVYTGFPGYYRAPYAVETERNLPPESVPLRDDARVLSADDEHVGDVERLFTAEDGEVTHLLIRSGLLSVTRKLIPTHWIRSVSEDTVHLAVSEDTLKNLSDYEQE
jgi:uncharacterized protein YrrD